jgi:hypothetical protein
MYVLVVAVYETAKMLLAQPTESISNSEEMFFVRHVVNWGGLYTPPPIPIGVRVFRSDS